MIYGIAKFISGLFGWDISKVQRYVFWAVMLAALAILLFLVLQVRSCFNRPPKLDQQDIGKAQQAIATNDRKEMVEVLAKSDVAEQGIDNSIKAAENATEQAKQSYADKSNEELAAEIERRLNESN